MGHLDAKGTVVTLPTKAKRDWTAPLAKIASERVCRVCKSTPVDPAHIIPRSRVAPGAGEDPLNVVPLCRRHHAAFDAHRFDLVPYLTREEQANAVALVGISEAMRRLTGSRLAA